jgi:heptosyltransferase-2
LHRHFTAGFISFFSGSDKVYGFKKNPLSIFFDYRAEHIFREGIHEVDRNLGVLKPLKIEAKRQPVLYPSDSDFQLVLDYKSIPYVCIAPASVWFTKRYPEELWVELINTIPDIYKIYLLGSPSDRELCESIKTACRNVDLTNLAGCFSMLQSAALMKDAAMNYVNDSAPLHFSSAMNARVTAIYCSTVPEFGFGPLGSNTYIVEIREKIDCRPCGIHGHNACPKSHFNCAKKIKLDDLLKPIL